ncbi:MAG: FAD-binding domain-containing protein [Pikeienuella sp.]|uniref:FAD-binding domain-containing protein n=1 Tax=Pikeienuella sp. TaxID=2831957 RepID=UPI00391CDE18
MEGGWRPDRASGLARLAEFAPRAGSAYAERRNFDFGPADRSNVSGLSPYLRHRLILEDEALSAALAAHGPEAAGKFVEEVFWRSYYKGWMERRPAIWRAYRVELDRQLARFERNPGLFAAYEAAVSGRAGIEGFDDWARELKETGWLHNHARMWFASIWIFTLRLPWVLGADFFLRHLMDGDPASNTLGWRWVAGLHTQGKTYLARAENIETYTAGRFRPAGLATAAEAPPASALPATAPPPRGERFGGGRYGLLLHGEDCSPESLAPPYPPAAILGLSAVDGRSPLPAGVRARAFAEGALRDALARASARFGVEAERGEDRLWPAALIDWARRHDLHFIVTARPAIGPAAAHLDAAEPEMEAAGVRLIRLMRPHDEVAWPHADRGFFAMRRQIPSMLVSLGLA